MTRWDVNYVIGEFIGELNASHAYRGGGDMEQAPERIGRACSASTGSCANGRLSHQAHRPRRTVGRRRPLAAREPGVNVKEGDYLLAVNGVTLDTKTGSVGRVPGARRQDDRSHRQRKRHADGARQVVVNASRAKSICGTTHGSRSAGVVDKATGGKVGYIYVQSTASKGRTICCGSSSRSARRTASSSTSAGTAAGRFPTASSSC